MNVMQNMKSTAVFFSQFMEHVQCVAHVIVLIKIRSGKWVLWRDQIVRIASVKTQLAANVPVPFRPYLFDFFIQRFHGIRYRVGVGRDCRSGLSSQQLVQRHIRKFSLDIPKGHVDPGDGVVQHGTVAPIGIVGHEVPEVLNLVGVPPDQKGLHIFLNSRLHRKWPELKGRTAHAANVFIRAYLHDGQIVPVGPDHIAFDICDNRWGHDRDSPVKFSLSRLRRL